MAANNLDYFTQIIHNSRAHPIFKKDWFSYDSHKFANTFLPYAKGYQGTGTLIFDGAELFKNVPKAEKNILELPNQQLIHSLIYTYPKGVLAEQKKESVQPTPNEICSFVKIDEGNNVDISLKIGSNFKKFLNSFYSHTGKSNTTIQTLETKVHTMHVSDFKTFFKSGSIHKNHMFYVFKLLNLDENEVLDFIAYKSVFNSKFISYLENFRIAGKYKVAIFIEKSIRAIFDKTDGAPSKKIERVYPEKDEIYIWLVSKDYINYRSYAQIQLGCNVTKDFIEKEITNETLETLIIEQIKKEIGQEVLSNDSVEEKVDRAIANSLLSYALNEELEKDPIAKEIFKSSPTAFFALKAAEFTADSIKKYRLKEHRWNPNVQDFDPLFKGNTTHNAYFCGIINGIIDLAAGIPEMVSLLSKILYSPSFAKEFFGGIKKLFDEGKVIETILEALSKDYKNAKSPEELFYYMALDVVSLISILIVLYNSPLSFIITI
jgi:hypothetical protein